MSIAYEDMKARLTFGIPDRLGKALTVAGITSNEMADYLGVSRTTISNYINGRTPTKKQTRRLWALRTGVPLTWLETGDFGEAPTPPVGIAGAEPPQSTVKAQRSAIVTYLRQLAAPAQAAA